jgi:hypothetical protein
MEKRLKNKITEHFSVFKNDMKRKVMTMDVPDTERDAIITYIHDYQMMELTQDDFVKRKRVKNVVPLFDRCVAKRANNEQCSRRKKDGCEYCGTHLKGTPNGMVSTTIDGDDNHHDSEDIEHRVEVWAQEIMGITYYIDGQYNVYQAEDVIMNKENPKIIAKYVKNEDGSYHIPSYNL